MELSLDPQLSSISRVLVWWCTTVGQSPTGSWWREDGRGCLFWAEKHIAASPLLVRERVIRRGWVLRENVSYIVRIITALALSTEHVILSCWGGWLGCGRDDFPTERSAARKRVAVWIAHIIMRWIISPNWENICLWWLPVGWILISWGDTLRLGVVILINCKEVCGGLMFIARLLREHRVIVIWLRLLRWLMVLRLLLGDSNIALVEIRVSRVQARQCILVGKAHGRWWLIRGVTKISLDADNQLVWLLSYLYPLAVHLKVHGSFH